ncbi:hypothetical protein QE389_001966 [Brevundimonas sp. SORGH_AS 993]|nr:hypothetical protein [Brevundimonas sp. SORGH_AS_0993]
MSNLAELNRRWSVPDYPPTPVSAEEIAEAERNLSFSFPATYRDSVLATGLPRLTTELWEDIEAAGLDLPHLCDFLTPQETVSTTRDYRDAGMPANLVGFASDSGGNLFVFRSDTADDAVWMFDHDFLTVKSVAPSFEAWLKVYGDVPQRAA